MNELIKIIPTLPLIENPEDINEATRIEQDLRISLYQARMFLIRYSERFNVDISKFRTEHYFSKDSSWSRFYRHYIKRKKNMLTMGDLWSAVAYGKLNNAVLNDIAQKNTKKVPHNKIYFKTSYHQKFEERLINALLCIALAIFLAIVAMYI